MHHECICTVESWQKGPGCYDTIFVNTDPSMDGMQGLKVACVCLFFSFSHENVEYPCALVLDRMILACGQLSWICQMMAKLLSLSSTSIQLFEHHISFQCSVIQKNAFPRLFHSQTHLTHILVAPSSQGSICFSCRYTNSCRAFPSSWQC